MNGKLKNIELTIELKVWTNGNAIRKYIGQDKYCDKDGWFKATAIITPVKEDED